MADELALVLAASGIPVRIAEGAEGFDVVVPTDDMRAAVATLAAYEWENVRREPPPAVAPRREGGLVPALCSVAVLLAAYLLTGPRDAASPAFEAGTADAAGIRAGEWWRTVTALTLHADASHLASNAIAGFVLVAAVCRTIGGGIGVLLVVLAGVAGNALNALLRAEPHFSVGASTSVLGAVGVLSGLAWVRARRERRGLARAWLPMAAGLALLAMLGADERTDLGAHLFGFVAGAGLGLATGLLAPEPPGRTVQGLAGAAALALLGVAWRLALAA